MDTNELEVWLKDIVRKVPEFLSEMCSGPSRCPVRYSRTGDILGSRFHWGLGNSVFAVKCYSILNAPPEHLSRLVAHIKSFQRTDGFFSDPWIRTFSFPLRMKQAVRSLDFRKVSHLPTMRAETRQAMSALALAGADPDRPFLEFPATEEAIRTFLSDLDWSLPWGAGSHFSHLVFFLGRSNLAAKQQLIRGALQWLRDIQQADGCWYRGETSAAQKINGAMKVITGLRAVCPQVPEAREVLRGKAPILIDTVLDVVKGRHACDHFNITYVLRWAAAEAAGYRHDEIKEFFYRQLDFYRQFYFESLGGFSFEPGRANRIYYNAPITLGRNEPDIHGTIMFLWGLSTISGFLGLEGGVRLIEIDA